MISVVLKIAGVAAGLYALLLVAGYAGQRRLIYFPDPTRVDPTAINLPGVREIELAVGDGARVVAWYAPARPGQRTILYFHGNGAGLADRAERMRIATADGFGMLMMAYRGYAGSTGKPSEAANVADALKAYDWLRGEGVAPERLVIFGESLGTGVATQVAAQRPAAALVLDSPFSSMADVASHHYPYVPIRLILRDRYDSVGTIGKVRMPLLILHGARDAVVPQALGRKLFTAANEPKTFYSAVDSGHLVPFSKGAWSEVRRFLEALPRPATAG
jgi:hypothetical protein